MKLNKLALLISMLIAPSLSSALTMPLGGFYAGMDMYKSLSDYTLKDKNFIVVMKQSPNLRRSAPMLNVYGGWKFNRFSCVEFGYFTETSVKRLNSNIVNKLSGAHGTLLLNITINEKFEIKPGLGMSWNKYLNNPPSPDYSKKVIVVAPRLVVALEYTINDAVRARASIVSHRAKMDNTHDNFRTSNLYKVGLGMNYIFS